MAPGLLLIILCSVRLASADEEEHWCHQLKGAGVGQCPTAIDEINDDEYSVVDPTDKEKEMCAEDTMIYVDVKDNVRYCFMKDQQPTDRPVRLVCEPQAHPYECPDLEHWDGWGYDEWEKDSHQQHTLPAKWHTVHKECGGERQSPINLPAKKKISAENVKNKAKMPLEMRNYETIPYKDMIIKNNGHTVLIRFREDKQKEDQDYVISGGPLEFHDLHKKFFFLEVHFHWGSDDSKGSEHNLNGKRFPMEMHMIHKSILLRGRSATKGDENDAVPDGLVVMAFFFKICGENEEMELLKPLVKVLKDVTKKNTTLQLKTSIDMTEVIRAAKGNYYSYKGSLTTPSCDQVVRWINFEKPLCVSHEQLEMFRKLKTDHRNPLQDNFRPVQELNPANPTNGAREVEYWT